MAWQDKRQDNKRNTEKSFESSILKTLIYSDFFNYPLTKKEIQKWLVRDAFVFNQKKFDDLLKKMLSKREIDYTEGFYFPRKRKEVVGKRKNNQIFSREKLVIARQTARKLEKLPWIKMLGITGALSMENCPEDDDIDLMVITENNRLWLTRFLVLTLAPILKINRRKPKQTKVENKICFNLFLDENHLKMPSPSFFVAHEISQIIVLINKNQTFERLLWDNQWINNYLMNIFKCLKIRLLPDKKVVSKSTLFVRALDLANKVLFKMQYFYMIPKITKERISYYQAFFHPRDFKKETEEKIPFLTKI